MALRTPAPLHLTQPHSASPCRLVLMPHKNVACPDPQSSFSASSRTSAPRSRRVTVGVSALTCGSHTTDGRNPTPASAAQAVAVGGAAASTSTLATAAGTPPLAQHSMPLDALGALPEDAAPYDDAACAVGLRSDPPGERERIDNAGSSYHPHTSCGCEPVPT
eukprot:365303-Chlamydomonas_euryale.AAC.58